MQPHPFALSPRRHVEDNQNIIVFCVYSQDSEDSFNILWVGPDSAGVQSEDLEKKTIKDKHYARFKQ